MRLISCHVENYGCIRNLDLNFLPETNLILRKNGWGKSTLASFLASMFYGFDGERKKNAADREREKYRPWQGGTYGGEVIFSYGDRNIRISRVFREKESNDECIIRDAETGKKITEFTGNPGEMIFHMDKASFLRTIFVRQNEISDVSSEGRQFHLNSEQGITGDMRLRISHIPELSDDLGSLDDAMKRINDALNKFSPDRKTGRLFQMKAELTSVETELLQAEILSKKLAYYRGEYEKNRAESEKNRDDLAKNQQMLQEALREEMLLEKKAAWDKLKRNEMAAKTKVQALRASFKEEVPESKDVDRKIEDVAAARTLFARAEEKSFTEEEKWRYFSLLGKREHPEEEQAAKKRILPMLFLIFGISLAVLSLAYLVLYYLKWPIPFYPGVSVLALGVIFFILGLCFRGAEKKRLKKLQEARNLEDREEEAEFQRLSGKQREQDRLNRLGEEKLNEILTFIGNAMEPEPSRTVEQLLEIKKRLFELNEAKKALFSAEQDKREYVSRLEYPVSEVENCRKNENLPTPEELKKAIAGCYDKREKLMKWRTDLSRTLEELEHQEAELRELQGLYRERKEQYEKLTKKYALLQKTQRYLTDAKEELLSSMRQPVLRSFRKYYEKLTGETADITIDSDLHFEIRAGGRYRGTEGHSQGIRDLLGLAVRLSYTEAMVQEEKPFIILDDPFVHLDRNHIESGIALLKEIGKEYQIIYMTCHESRR